MIGRRGINIKVAEALDYIAGFTIFNDVSARDQQFAEMKKGVGPSKSKDFCNILGPTLVTVDEVDPANFGVEVCVNGEQWAKTDTRGMNASWQELVAYASKEEPLVPGDILTSGTVDGCCALEHFNWPDDGPLLSPGDVIELNVAGIGTLRNRVQSRAATADG